MIHVTEELLYFIWSQKTFDVTTATTTEGQKLDILDFGFRNEDSGPDFSESKIRCDEVVWFGNVEMHVKSSDWQKHGHYKDPLFQSVILHVVWEHDEEVLLSDGSIAPVLELKQWVDPGTLSRSNSLLNSISKVSCAQWVSQVDPFVKSHQLERAAVSRLERKGHDILKIYEEVGKDWRETAFRVLAKNFGFKTNQLAFESLAERLTHKPILKHRDQLVQIEALLFGVSGLLDSGKEDDYRNQLKAEWKFLATKYDLKSKQLELANWKFSRLRPVGFPTIRLAQFSAFLHQTPEFFSQWMEEHDWKQVAKSLRVKQSDYWSKHHLFGEKSEKPLPGLGQSSVENLIINTVAPLLTAYGLQSQDENYRQRAMAMLEGIHAEDNKVTREMKSHGFESDTALGSQGMIELFNEQCKNKKCLSCGVGSAILHGRAQLVR